jgi:hypothetical protein
VRVLKQNAAYMDKKQHRKAVEYKAGDAVTIWGPISSGAKYPSKPKLLYKWSLPCVVKEKVSDIHYKLLREERKGGAVEYVVTPPIHVNRLRPYQPLEDGMPSVSNAQPPTPIWAPPAEPPKAGQMVVVRAEEDDWQDKPVVVAKVLHVYEAKLKEEKGEFLVHFYGNFKGSVRGPHLPGFVDSHDGKLIFLPAQKSARYKPWTNTTTKARLARADILMVEPALTSKSRLRASVMDWLGSCPYLDCTEQVGEPGLFEEDKE